MPSQSARYAALALNSGLFDAVRQWVAYNYPEFIVDEIALTLRDPLVNRERQVLFPVTPACPCTPANDAEEIPEPETPMEQDILQTVGDEPMLGEDICEKSGYKWGGTFRGRLARMARVGLLEKTGTGYKRGPSANTSSES